MDLSAESHVVVCGLQRLIFITQKPCCERDNSSRFSGLHVTRGSSVASSFLACKSESCLASFSPLSLPQQVPSPMVGGLVPLGVCGVHLCPPCPFRHSTEDVLTTQAKATPHGIAMHLMAF